jgi:hypothetical protein
LGAERAEAQEEAAAIWTRSRAQRGESPHDY